ncbi:MAG: hypothetical protein AAF596_07285 [Planctomycetota bacterium]
MGKLLAIGGMVIAGLVTLLFGLDLVAGVPFSGANRAMNIGFIVCGLVLAYLSWNAFRDIKG